MAKKRFRDDLESLFGPDPKPLSLFPDETPPQDADPEETESVTVDVTVRRREVPKGSTKGFSDSLDAFFSEAFEGPDPAPERQSKRQPRRRRTTARPRGLDMLIQNTTVKQINIAALVRGEKQRQGHGGGHTRRVTLLFNKKHLERLKAIAREKDLLLKDIVSEIVEEYLRRKGS